MKHETYRGKVVYRSDTLGERGREWFTVTKHGGGHRTIRSFVEVLNTGLVRDVTYTVDDNWQPVDAFVRLTENDEFMGAAGSVSPASTRSARPTPRMPGAFPSG